jgi:HTH-type transcriptional regulator / antitoxin HigA
MPSCHSTNKVQPTGPKSIESRSNELGETMTEQTFQPDWQSHPGETIADFLEEGRLSVHQFARRMQLEKQLVEGLIRGQAELTPSIAEKLSSIVGSTPEFWLQREIQFRIAQGSRLSSSLEAKQWIKSLPVTDMIKFGWIGPDPGSNNRVHSCLSFFGVSALQEWHDKYDQLLNAVAFRTSHSFDSNTASVAAWLRQAEVQAASIACQTWNAKKLQSTLPQLRRLTRDPDPQSFIPTAQQLCAACGVAFVVVRSPAGCRASGATRFLSKKQAIVVLSIRYLSDDHFWFTFFHEIAHLLLHAERGLFLEGTGMPDDTFEVEANEFAAHTLISQDQRAELKNLSPTIWNIARFARRINVAPGIVVGQMQHSKMLRPNQYNALKRRFQWSEKNHH